MRIIAGTLKGQQFQTPHSHKTHPMGDKIRGALFNVLGDIEGLSFLDAFSGSGALAFEAASRGAASVLASGAGVVACGAEVVGTCAEGVSSVAAPSTFV